MNKLERADIMSFDHRRVFSANTTPARCTAHFKFERTAADGEPLYARGLTGTAKSHESLIGIVPPDGVPGRRSLRRPSPLPT
jgi:hypothetical protein